MERLLDSLWRFLVELRRRKVYRAVTAYAVGAFAVLEAADLILGALDADAGLPPAAIVLALAGFPGVAILSWMYELTPAGVRRTAEASQIALPARSKAFIGGVFLLSATVVAASAWWIVNDAGEKEGPVAPPSAAPALAVLPFADLTGRDADHHLVEGIHSALITQLARLEGLRTRSRTSVLMVDRERGPAAVAEGLNVDFLVEGSVARSGDSLRVDVHVVQAPSWEVVWTERFDGTLHGVFELEDRIVGGLARGIDLTLSADEKAFLTDARTVAPQAYDLYARAALLNDGSEHGVRRAIAHLRQAVEIDPGFARGHAQLAGTLAASALLGASAPEDVVAEARAAAWEARRLDERLPEAWWAVAAVRLFFDWEWERAGEAVERALALSGGDWRTQVGPGTYYHYLTATAQEDRLVAALERELELDPLSPVVPWAAGFSHFLLGHYDRALPLMERALEMQPGFHWAVVEMAWIHAFSGDREAAREWALRADSIPVDDQWYRSSLGHVFALVGLPERAEATLADLERRRDAGEYTDLFNFAVLHAALGRLDHAAANLRQAHEQKQLSLITLPYWRLHFLRPLADHPVLLDILAGMRLPRLEPAEG